MAHYKTKLSLITLTFLCLTIVTSIIYLNRNEIKEAWYLREFNSSSESTQLEAAHQLGKLSSFPAFEKIFQLSASAIGYDYELQYIYRRAESNHSSILTLEKAIEDLENATITIQPSKLAIMPAEWTDGDVNNNHPLDMIDNYAKSKRESLRILWEPDPLREFATILAPGLHKFHQEFFRSSDEKLKILSPAILSIKEKHPKKCVEALLPELQNENWQNRWLALILIGESPALSNNQAKKIKVLTRHKKPMIAAEAYWLLQKHNLEKFEE